MLRGPGGAATQTLEATARGEGGTPTRFTAHAGRVTGVYGDGAQGLVHALGGGVGSGWRRHRSHATATPAAPVPATEHTVWHLLAAVAAQFGHPSPTCAAAAVADAAALGDLRARQIATLTERDRRCLAIAVAALTGTGFVVAEHIDDGLASREVAVVARAAGGCAAAFGLGFVFAVATTRNAFWGDDVWRVDARHHAEQVSTAPSTSPMGAARPA